MWKKIKEILCKHTVYKDESSTVSGQSTATTSVINLKPLPEISLRQTETLHHHHIRPYRKVADKSTLNKTDEHCRSLFNLLPISFRPRHLHQTANNKSIDVSTTTQASPSIDVFGTDYDSGYMSQSVLNRTPSYASCYSSVATTVPIPTMNRHGSIESLLEGHSKSNPASIRVIVRKNFDSFAQAHISVTKGSIVTAIFLRGPWLYVRSESNGKTGYIPRIICSLYKNGMTNNEKNYYKSSEQRRNHHNNNNNNHYHHMSISSTDSTSNKDEELDLTVLSKHDDSYFVHPYRQQINRYLSQSSTIINDKQQCQENVKQRFIKRNLIERERRNTCTLPPPLSSKADSLKDRRLTLTSINYPITTNKSDTGVGIHQVNDISSVATDRGPLVLLPQQQQQQQQQTTTTATTTAVTATRLQRDTDSSSTQDSGYSESTPYYIVQQSTVDPESISTITNTPKKSASSSHYASLRHPTLLKVPDTATTTTTTTNQHSSLRRHSQQQTNRAHRPLQHRHTLVNGLSINTMLANHNKRHSFGTFYINNCERDEQQTSVESINLPSNSLYQKSYNYASLRNVYREKDHIYQQIKPTIHNLPESHHQIPASIMLNHHRQQQKQQFGSSHSAFRPVQPAQKSKRASSEGHSPSSEHRISSPTVSTSSSSSSSSSLSSSSSSFLSSTSKKNKLKLLKQRRLSCDLSVPTQSTIVLNSLTRSICDRTSTKKLSNVTRTMSDTLCDQFSEINLDAIEKDSLAQPPLNKIGQNTKQMAHTQQNLFTIIRDYRSSRASFSVKRGDCVHVIKQVGRACYLVRKQNNGQIGFLPKALMIPTTTSKVDTFLEMHGYRETII